MTSTVRCGRLSQEVAGFGMAWPRLSRTLPRVSKNARAGSERPRESVTSDNCAQMCAVCVYTRECVRACVRTHGHIPSMHVYKEHEKRQHCVIQQSPQRVCARLRAQMRGWTRSDGSHQCMCCSSSEFDRALRCLDARHKCAGARKCIRAAAARREHRAPASLAINVQTTPAALHVFVCMRACVRALVRACVRVCA